MKKENKSSIFLSVIAVIILICAALLLVIASLSFISAPKNQGYYDLIKDHGSLIAGVLAVIAAIITIIFHWFSTNKAIDSNNDISFQEKKINAQLQFEVIWESLEIIKLNEWAISNQNREKLKENLSFNDVLSSIRYLKVFVKTYSENCNIVLLEFIESYIWMLKESVDYGLTADLIPHVKKIRLDLIQVRPILNEISHSLREVVLSDGTRVIEKGYLDMLANVHPKLSVTQDLGLYAMDNILPLLDDRINKIKRK